MWCDHRMAFPFSSLSFLDPQLVGAVFRQAMVVDGSYMLMSKLLAISSCVSPLSHFSLVLPQEVHTPLKACQWSKDLQRHPDKQFCSFIVQGITSGFRIGFDRSSPLQSATKNLHSSNPAVISEHLEREVLLQRSWKVPLNNCPFNIHISPVGAIPKKNKPNKWRLIVDLSSPQGSSVNDGISPQWSSLSYTSLDHLAAMILAVGRGSLLVKADIQEAYRMIPVHPQDQPLLGVHWNNFIYIDRVLPFGLRSAPIIFTAVADGLQWILIQEGITHLLHYLDDYIFVASSEEEANSQKSQFISTCSRLGVPLEMSKLEGPATCLTLKLTLSPCNCVYLPISCQILSSPYLTASVSESLPSVSSRA